MSRGQKRVPESLLRKNLGGVSRAELAVATCMQANIGVNNVCAGGDIRVGAILGVWRACDGLEKIRSGVKNARRALT